MSAIATDGKLITRLVVHDLKYAGKQYELQTLSHDGRWVTATTSSLMKDIGSWANRHCYPLPDQITPCGVDHNDGLEEMDTRTKNRFARVDNDLVKMNDETLAKVKYFIMGAMVAGASTQMIYECVNKSLGVKVCYDTVDELEAIVHMEVKR